MLTAYTLLALLMKRRDVVMLAHRGLQCPFLNALLPGIL